MPTASEPADMMATDTKVETKKLVQKLRKRGFVVSQASNGHLHVKQGGRRIATLASTPSDIRSLENAYADLRRAGINIRRPSKPRKGSVDDWAMERLRKRMGAVLAKMTIAEFARTILKVQAQRGIVGISTADSAQQTVRRIRDGGSVTKSVHDAIAATLNALERDKSWQKRTAHQAPTPPPPAPVPAREPEPELQNGNVLTLRLEIPASERAYLRELLRDLFGRQL